ncbi:MAG: hypothetical protein Crog4KO_36020 [Crocinitomicaceae bacterium]
MPSKNAPSHYQIKIKGQLSTDWSDWFSELALSHDDNGNTILSGEVVDQSALHGLLKRIRDMGLELVSINQTNE